MPKPPPAKGGKPADQNSLARKTLAAEAATYLAAGNPTYREMVVMGLAEPASKATQIKLIARYRGSDRQNMVVIAADCFYTGRGKLAMPIADGDIIIVMEKTSVQTVTEICGVPADSLRRYSGRSATYERTVQAVVPTLFLQAKL
jgi:hypothetical protein